MRPVGLKPVLMHGLPGNSACVSVGPPLSCSGPRLSGTPNGKLPLELGLSVKPSGEPIAQLVAVTTLAGLAFVGLLISGDVPALLPETIAEFKLMTLPMFWV